jgi:vesicle coat complex subunit
VQKDEFLRLAINAIHNDLISRNEAFQSLALTFVSNSALRALGLQLLRCTAAAVTV